MRELTATLLAAQKQGSGVPYVKVQAGNKVAGAFRLKWERLYEGTEEGNDHSLTFPGDGSMIRVRAGPPADTRKLYRQRVVNPGPESDFGAWTYTGQYSCIAVAAVSCGAEVLVFWIKSDRQLWCQVSDDYGVSWGYPQLIDYSASTSVYGFAAAGKPNGDIALFFCDQINLYVKRRVGGSWQAKTVWDKSTGLLSGVAAACGSDWNLVVSGKDTSDNYKVWSLVYGDGGEVENGTWSALREFASAPSDGEFEFSGVSLDAPDVYRCFYIEKYSGVEPYSRPFGSRSVAGAAYTGSLWSEPVPFDLESECGLAMAHHGAYCWLSCPCGVWRAEMVEETTDLTGDVISLRQETVPGSDRLTVSLRNDDGQYGSLPSSLEAGCRIDVSPGYLTGEGNEVSDGQSYILEASEYVSRGGQSVLCLYGPGGRSRISEWTAGCQLRFNKASEEMNVKEILEFILSRESIALEVISQSSAITNFYPDFTIHAGNSGDTLLRRLLSFVPDSLFIEGDTAWLLNPQSSDSSVYSYGQDHAVLEGRYRAASWKLNRVTVEGYDPVGEVAILKDNIAWDQIAGQRLRARRLEDRNIGTVEGAEERGLVYLRKAETGAVDGTITVPVNCGQQVCDVIDITDERAGLAAEKKRITGITFVYAPDRGEYCQTLSLGAV